MSKIAIFRPLLQFLAMAWLKRRTRTQFGYPVDLFWRKWRYQSTSVHLSLSSERLVWNPRSIWLLHRRKSLWPWILGWMQKLPIPDLGFCQKRNSPLWHALNASRTWSAVSNHRWLLQTNGTFPRAWAFEHRSPSFASFNDAKLCSKLSWNRANFMAARN